MLIPSADDELCEQFSNLTPNEDNDEATVSLSPSERYAKGLELIAGRDEMERMLTDEANAKELSEKEDLGHLSYLIMAMHTVSIAECGIYEEEKHMSLIYAEAIFVPKNILIQCLPTGEEAL